MEATGGFETVVAAALAAAQLPLAVVMSLALVRPLKGMLIALQFANKAEQGRFR